MIRQIYRQADQPLPIEKIDKDKRVKWGEKNLYPQYLVGLVYDNPVHGGIVNQKIKFITAGGIEVTNTDASNNGMSAYNYPELVDMICQDSEIFNGFSVIYKKELSTGFWHAEPVDFELIRATESQVYFDYSDDWSKQQQTLANTGYRQIKSIMHVTDQDTECIFYNIIRPKQRGLLKQKGLTANYYPIPVYSGAITSIMAGIEMDFFTYSEVVNGYKGGTVISLLNGVPDTIQEENKIIERVKGEATDRDTQAGVTILFADGKDRAPEIAQMNGNDLDKRYIESDKNILKKIMIAHGVISPTLFGVLSETMFGSKEEMEIAYTLWKENYGKVRQKFMADGLNWAFKKLNQSELGLSFKEYVLSLSQNVEVETPVQPVATFSQDDSLRIIEMFGACGVERSTVRIMASRDYCTTDDNEDEFKASFISGKFAVSLSDDDKNIVQMIKAGESYDSISKAIDKGGVYLSKRLIYLQENGFIDKWTVTDKGVQASATLSDIEVLYSYEKKPTAPDLVAGGESRPFCKKMLEIDRLYTRQEIDQISLALGKAQDYVWNYRGGWYHNPDTDKNTPSCRHLWKQNIIVN